VFLPWSGFNREAPDWGASFHVYDVKREAYEIASRFHPRWAYLTDSAMKLHARNAYQVLGPRLDDPSEVLICWTPDGAQSADETSRSTGGTGTAIRIADHYGVRIFNLRREGTIEYLDAVLRTINIERRQS
jgi:hypothetical protein